MGLCKDCFRGVTHEGTPQGKWEKIGGVDCYVVTPPVDYSKDKLLADDFAANGFKTIIPDYFNGDYVPADAMHGKNFDGSAWLKRHGPAQIQPPLDNVISALKLQGVTIFGAAGYCMGARYALNLAFKNIISVAVCSHPSLIKVPSDFEIYKSTSKAPLLINSCTIDEWFPPHAQEKADEVMRSFKPGYKREYWEGCTHGFAVRGDMSDSKVKAGKEGAFNAAVAWFRAKL
ncbi:chlorocatechol-degradation protein [Cyathus striatus]|nr:chlorocatechol-degradation protein [Cyathus striatus]